MNPLEQLNSYVQRLERRLRIAAITRGVAIATVVALLLTIILVLMANRFAFSTPSVQWSRFLLFVSLALVTGFGLIIPVLRLSRKRAVRRAEEKNPDLKERLLTFVDNNETDPFIELLAEDTLPVANKVGVDRVVPKSWIFGFSGSAIVAVLVLLWLVTSGPGFLGYGSSLLWAGTPRAGVKPIYDVIVTPGNLTVRRRSDQAVRAQLLGFEARKVALFAKYKGTSKWEEVPMQPERGSNIFGFLFAGLADTVEYYVEAGAVRSKTYTLTTLDLPGVKKIRVTYHYPGWIGLKDAVEDPGGDLRAVEGTEAEVAIETDRPLKEGALVLDNDNQIPLRGREGNWLVARVPIQKDGMYHVAALEPGKGLEKEFHTDAIRLSEDYFIEARKDLPPTVRLVRPGRDLKVNPVEEVSVALEAADDFGLQQVDLHYSVNGGPEKTVAIAGASKTDAKKVEGRTTIYLEDYKMAPGDLVSLYATARDAHTSTRTDMFFIEAQPFEREYSQSQQMGGGGGGQQEQEDKISARQKEIIAATWNEVKGDKKDRARAAEDGKFLSNIQAKLRDQSKSLAERMKSRQLAQTNQQFQGFVKDMEQAAEAMGLAVDKLKSLGWKDALMPEQKALQHLLRAEASFREIQVAMGKQGGGGGGGGGRDLESLFDLELDTEKNQYETGQQSASADQRAKEIDEALQKLEQLARRQQELAAQQKQQKQSFEQRWEQEVLRREAEQLQRKMEQLTRGQESGSKSQDPSGQQQGGQQSASRQSGSQQSGSKQSGSQQMTPRNSGQQAGEQQLQQSLERLAQATEDMRKAASPSGASVSQAEAQSRRAAERLGEARDLLSGLRRQESSAQMDQLVKQTEQLAAQQKNFQERARKAFGGDGQLPGQMQLGQPGQNPQQVAQMASEKQQMSDDLEKMERQIQNAVRDLAGAQPTASSKLREALGELQKDEIGLRMKYSAQRILRGMGAYTWVYEATNTAGLERLRDQVKQARAAMQPGSQGEVEKALAQVEKLRGAMERAASRAKGSGAKGQQPGEKGQQAAGSGKEPGSKPGGQQGSQQAGQQGGQQPGQSASGQAGSGQPGSGQPGGGSLGGAGGSYGPRGGPGPVGPSIGSQEPVTGEQAYREAMRDLAQLRQSLQRNPELARDFADPLRELQRIDMGRFAGNQAQLDQVLRQVIPTVEQLELLLRRKLEEKNSAQVRSGASEPIPSGYGNAVADYYRRLSRNAGNGAQKNKRTQPE